MDNTNIVINKKRKIDELGEENNAVDLAPKKQKLSHEENEDRIKLPNLSAASIRMQSLESEFSSGKDLFEKDNKPRSVLAIKNRLQADFDMNKTIITVSPDGRIVGTQCDCSKESSYQWCAHVIATILFVSNRASSVVYYDALKERINSLSIEELRNGLLNTVFAHPSALHVEVDCILNEPSFLATQLSEDIDRSDKQKTQSSAGVEDVINRIKNDLKNALRKYEQSRVFESSEDSYDDSPELGEGDFSFIKNAIEPYLIRIANLYHQGETQTAIEIGIALTDELMNTSIGESEIHIVNTAQFVDLLLRMESTWTRLITYWTYQRDIANSPEGQINQDIVIKLQQKLTQWRQMAIDNLEDVRDFDVFKDCISANNVGWGNDTLKHILAGDIPLMVPRIPEVHNNDNEIHSIDEVSEEEEALVPVYIKKESLPIIEARIDALCLLGKAKEAVNLSTASGEHFKAAELLLAHGKIEQAVSEALKQNIDPGDAIKFAKSIRDQDPTGAFCVAVIGLKSSFMAIAMQVYLHYELPERWNASELGRWTLDFVLNFAKKKKSELNRQRSALAITIEPMEVETIVIDDEATSKSSVAPNTILPLAELASQSCVTILAEQEMGSVKRVLDSVPPEIQERLMIDILVELAGKEKYGEIRAFMLGQVDTLLRHKLFMPALRVLIAGSKSQFAHLRRAIDVASKMGSTYLVETVTKCLKHSNMRRIESEDALALAIHLLDKGFPREAISMGFLALSHTNNWQTTTKKEIVGWIFKNAAAADCWNLIEEKLPSILGDLNNDASLLLELAKQCERDDKIQLAIRLGMGALRREPEDNGRNNIYEYEGTYNTSAITTTSSNQSAVTWLLQLITNTKEKTKLLKELATKATEVLASTTLFKLAKEFHDLKEDATAISLGMSAAAKAHSNASTPRFEVFIWCVKLALSLPQSKDIDEAMEKGLPLVDNGKDALQLADIIYKGERDELALKFAMRALGTIRNTHHHQQTNSAYWLVSKPITEDYYTPLSEDKVKLVDEALTFIAKIGKKLKCLDEVSRQHLRAINNSDVLWAFAKMLFEEKEEAIALEYGHQAVKEVHSTRSGLLLWVCKLAQSMGQLLSTLNVIKGSLKNFDELYDLSRYCHGLGHAEYALTFALDSLKYISALSAETREEALDYVMELVLTKRDTPDFELNIKKIAAQLKLAKDLIHVANLCIKNKFPDLGLEVGLTIFRRDRTFDKADLLWVCEQSWKIAKDWGITRVIDKCLANTSKILDIISLAYFVHDVVNDKMRALELGEKALALVPQANQAQLNRSTHVHHHEHLIHMRHRYLQRIISDSYSSDSEEMDIVPMEEMVDFDTDLNANVPRKITFGDSDDPKFLSKFCTWLCDLAHNFGQDRFRMTIDKCCEVLQRSQDNFEFARYVKTKGDVLKAARIMKDALNKTPPINMGERRDYAKELYAIFWENAEALQNEQLPDMESFVAYISSCSELLDFADWIINLGTGNVENVNNNNTNVEPAKKKRGSKGKKPVEKMIVEEPLGGNPRMDTIKDALFIGRRSLEIPSTLLELKRKASKWLLEMARLVKDAATEKKALAALFTTEPSLELLLEIKETMDPAFWPEERRNLLSKIPESHPVHIEIKFSDGQVEDALNSLSFGEQTLYNVSEANQRIPALLKATELFAKSKKLHKKEYIDKIVSLLASYVWRSWIPMTVTSGYQNQSTEVSNDQHIEQALIAAKEVAPTQIKALLEVHKVLSKGRRLHVMPKKPSYQELARVLGEIRPVYKKHDRMPEFNRFFELIKQTQSNRPVCIEILKTFEIQAKAEDMQNQLNELKNIVE